MIYSQSCLGISICDPSHLLDSLTDNLSFHRYKIGTLRGLITSSPFRLIWCRARTWNCTLGLDGDCGIEVWGFGLFRFLLYFERAETFLRSCFP